MQRLFECGVYSRAASDRGNTVFCVTYVNLYRFWSVKSGDKVLDYACKKFTSEIFAGENIPIYGSLAYSQGPVQCSTLYFGVKMLPLINKTVAAAYINIMTMFNPTLAGPSMLLFNSVKLPVSLKLCYWFIW